MIAEALIALACPGPPALSYDRDGDVVRTAVVACDGRRRVVLRQARLVRRTGTEITDVAGAGRRVAWGEVRSVGGRTAASLHVSRVAGGRIVPLHRRALARAGWDLEVKLTTHGELAWLTQGRVYATARLRGRARVVARRASYGLRLEDDRTLRWFAAGDEAFGFADLRPWPGTGCPRRSRFRRVAAGPEVVVTSGFWDTEYMSSNTVVRACVRATGADPVIAQGNSSGAGGESLTVAGVRGPWVVLVRDTWSRYDGCTPTFVEVVDAVDRREGRGGRFTCGLGPRADDPLVVTAGGAPAWILRSRDRSVLLTTAGDGGVELDSAGPEGLTGLVADGSAIRWLHDGEPRAADLG